MKTNRHLFIFSLLLTAPLVIYLLRYYGVHPAGLLPTGFTQPDNVAYMSNARQLLEQRSPGLTYSNPFSYTSLSPAIYSQPINFLLAPFLFLGVDPGFLFSLFGIISALACIYVTLRLVNYLYPALARPKTIYLLSIWGGGITALAGLLAAVFLSKGSYSGLDTIYRYDPGEGWWGLIPGRPLFLPLEAFYHLLFIACIFFLLKRRWGVTLLLSFILCWSHPFTGIEYLGIILGWLFLEKVLVSNRSIPWAFVAAVALLALLHVWYYLVYLNSFPEHKSLFHQFAVNWNYNYKYYIPAYSLVALLAYLAFRWDKKRAFFRTEHNRLFLCWAVIAFLFSKHDWFINPIQPLHFTRGYIWWGLFFLGIPTLDHLLTRLPNKTVFIAVVLLFLSDNILWYTSIVLQKPTREDVAYISPNTKQVLNWLHANTSTYDLLLSNEQLVSIMANAYASSYSCVSHDFNTPYYREKKEKTDLFFKAGVVQPEWENRRVLVLLKKNSAALPPVQHSAFLKLYENGSYALYQLEH